MDGAWVTRREDTDGSGSNPWSGAAMLPGMRPRGMCTTGIDAAVTARRFPDEPVFGSSAEQLFAEALQEQLPDDAVVFCNLRFSDGRQDREADVVVAWPGVGVAVVEVKGGSVSLDRGEWRQRQDGVDTVIHPVDQAVACKYLLCDYLAEHPRWSAGRPRTAHLVAVPATTLPGDFMAPGLARWMALDKTDVPHAAARIRAALEKVRDEPDPPTDAGHRRPGRLPRRDGDPAAAPPRRAGRT